MVSKVFIRTIALILKLPLLINFWKNLYKILSIAITTALTTHEAISGIRSALDWINFQFWPIHNDGNSWNAYQSTPWVSHIIFVLFYILVTFSLFAFAFTAQIISFFNAIYFKKSTFQSKVDIISLAWVIFICPFVYKEVDSVRDSLNLVINLLKQQASAFGVAAYIIKVFLQNLEKRFIFMSIIGLLIDIFAFILPERRNINFDSISRSQDLTMEVLILP